MAFVFSTLSCDQRYTEWLGSGADLQVAGRSVLIKGGTGVANDHGTRIMTPLGMSTEVSDADLAMLEKIPAFAEHKKNGYIKTQSKSAEPEKVAADMVIGDKSSPLTPSSPEMQAEDMKVVG